MDIKEILRFMNPLEIISNYEPEEFDDIIKSLDQLNEKEKVEFINGYREQFNDLKLKFDLFESKLQ